ncbi:hypothetical protein Dimus_019768 [Dionaea muscipula]
MRKLQRRSTEREMKCCELCMSPARMYCGSDQASLCWDCDSKIHGANFLVARHSRSLLCHVCQSPTPWSASGANLYPTVSMCQMCVAAGRNAEDAGSTLCREEDADEIDGDDELEMFSDDDEEEGDEMEEEGDDGGNEVVPRSSTTTTSPPPPATSSSTSEESCDEDRDPSTPFLLKRTREFYSDLHFQDDLSHWSRSRENRDVARASAVGDEDEISTITGRSSKVRRIGPANTNCPARFDQRADLET